MPATFSLVAAGIALVTLPHVTADRGPSSSGDDAPLTVGQLDPVRAAEPFDAAPSKQPAASESEPEPTAFAAVDGIELVLPGADVVAHGFHEAGSSGPEPLEPISTPQASETPNDVMAADAPVSHDDPDVLILPSRNRGTAPTSAVDIVLPDGDEVLAPVDGIVSMVSDYQLYGSTTDTLIHIQPTDAPHLQVAVLHVEGPTVAAGDQVRAGETVLADTARRLDVRNQIDRFVGESLPHVHIEVTRSGAVA